jgi:hypothetical protein
MFSESPQELCLFLRKARLEWDFEKMEAQRMAGLPKVVQ